MIFRKLCTNMMTVRQIFFSVLIGARRVKFGMEVDGDYVVPTHHVQNMLSQ